MENIMDYVSESAIVLVLALHVIGDIIKGIKMIPNKYIPVILLPFGIIGAVVLMGVTIDSILQGILITGAAVYTNEILKKSLKEQ